MWSGARTHLSLPKVDQNHALLATAIVHGHGNRILVWRPTRGRGPPRKPMHNGFCAAVDSRSVDRRISILRPADESDLASIWRPVAELCIIHDFGRLSAD